MPFLLVVILAALWWGRYVTLNRFYDDLNDDVETIYPVGETVPFGKDEINQGIAADGYSLCVDGFEIADFESIWPDGGITGTPPEKLALVTVTIQNDGSDAKGIPLQELGLYGPDEPLFLDYEMLDRLNPVLQGNTGIRLSDGTTCQLTLPYDLYRDNFSHGTWKALDRYPLFFQLTIPPMQKVVKVQ